MANALAQAILGNLATQQNLRMDPVKCVQVSPFLVEIAGSSTSVAAELIDGVTAFSLNEYGYCIWVPGHTPPICFTTS